MTEREFQDRLSQLVDQIAELPEDARERLTKLAEETRERHERMRTVISGLQESLDYLRLSVKYLVFDLEATKRENMHLRGVLDQRSEDEEPGDLSGD